MLFFSKIKEKVMISGNGNEEQKIFLSGTIWSRYNFFALSQGTNIIYTDMITRKQVEILIQLQKVFCPNMIDDLLAKIIGSRNMQTVLILSHILFRFLTFCSNFISNKHENHNWKWVDCEHCWLMALVVFCLVITFIFL